MIGCDCACARCQTVGCTADELCPCWLKAEVERLRGRIEKALGILNDPAWMFLNNVPAKVLSDASEALDGDA